MAQHKSECKSAFPVEGESHKRTNAFVVATCIILTLASCKANECTRRLHVIKPNIRSLEENVTEERQRGLPSLPARDPRFPQPPIYLAPKSSSDRNRGSGLERGLDTVFPLTPLAPPSPSKSGKSNFVRLLVDLGMASWRHKRRCRASQKKSLTRARTSRAVPLRLC